MAQKQNELEQQNTAIMNLLQTEYAQKISDAEVQANTVRGKLDELNRRMNPMEANINKLTQAIQSSGMPASLGMPVAKSVGPKITYTVQAIIPGRAWLKSENGDTVTVAEGDTLKGLGRVVKINPYDGVVDISVGNRIVTLSYGISS